MRYYVIMYDKKGRLLEIGDYVLYNGSQQNITNKIPATIAELNHKSATILFADNNMPLVIYSSYASLQKVDFNKINNKKRQSLKSVREIFNIIVREATSAWVNKSMFIIVDTIQSLDQ